MSIAKLNLINITSNLNNLDQVLMRLIDLKNFHPVLANKIVDRVHGLTSFTTDNPYPVLLNELNEIEKEFAIKLPSFSKRSLDYNFDSIRDYVKKIHKKLQDKITEIKEVQAIVRKYEDALAEINHIEGFNISLDDLFHCKYVYARVGRLPTDSVEKLKFYRNKPFIFKSFAVDQNYSWCIYLTTIENKYEIDNIFSSLFFERIYIPDFVHGTPGKAKETLEVEIKNKYEQIDKLKKELYEIINKSENDLASIKSEVEFLNEIYDAKKYVVGLGDRFIISGFAEVKDVKEIEEQFKGIDDLEFEIRPAKSDKRITPPTKLKNNWFTRPFAMFVEMYGVPEYGGVDPTPIVALTYSLLFGIMFGDLGQGLVLALLGYILFKWKKMRLGAIGVRIGISSAIFGFLYGSVFGNEELLTPFYTNVLGMEGKPIHTMAPSFTMTLLIGAILIGAILILMSMIMNIYIKIKKRQFSEMVFSHNGLSGFLFYGFIFVGLILSLQYKINIFSPLTIILFIILPLFMILLKEPLINLLSGKKMFPDGFGAFITEGFFELFETILSYLTNTMSFLRVGGFVLSHAGMMLVVQSLMKMTGDASLIVSIFGNIFVMALEGLIVGIQVLRLEFYEMFSRYYEGNGIAFETI